MSNNLSSTLKNIFSDDEGLSCTDIEDTPSEESPSEEKKPYEGIRILEYMTKTTVRIYPDGKQYVNSQSWFVGKKQPTKAKKVAKKRAKKTAKKTARKPVKKKSKTTGGTRRPRAKPKPKYMCVLCGVEVEMTKEGLGISRLMCCGHPMRRK